MTPVAFGDPNGPAWQRGESNTVAWAERYVEMACCGFRFSADHEDDGEPKGRYTCPCCAPRESEQRCRAVVDYVEQEGAFLPSGQFSIAIDSTKLAELIRLTRPDVTESP